MLTAGCGSLSSALGPMAQGRNISVAVESIDGPPGEISQKLISDLDAEGGPLRIAVVEADGQATYHMRGYLAAHPAGSATAIAWAWDVYDAEFKRAYRLSGEERVPAGKGTAKNWAVADEVLLHRIAHAGMDQLAGFIASPPAPAPAAPAPASPEPTGSDTVASVDGQDEPAGLAFAGAPRLAEAGTRR